MQEQGASQQNEQKQIFTLQNKNDGRVPFEHSPRIQANVTTLVKAHVKTTKLHPGEFLIEGESGKRIDQRILKRSVSSLCGFTNQSKCRMKAMRIIENKWFDKLIMTFIVLNSLTMAMNDYQADNRCAHEQGTQSCQLEHQTFYNRVLIILGGFFLWIFAIEACLKIFALGAVCGHKTYFKNAWNILDFIIVASGIIEFILERYRLQGVNMRVLRVLRVLRPLKAMKTLPSLRKQISALLMSIKGLVNVIVFLLFIFFLWSVVGLQWFVGSQHYACRTAEIPTTGTWQKYSDLTGEDSYGGICTPESNQYFAASFVTYQLCPEGYVCGSPLDHGLSLKDDNINSNAAINYGIGSFDNISQSLLAVFQIITMDGWTGIAYRLADYHALPAIPALFCVILIFMGAFFLLNLFLAVVMESYMQSEIKFNQEQADLLAKQELEITQRKLKSSLAGAFSFKNLKSLQSTNNTKDLNQSGSNLISAKFKQTELHTATPPEINDSTPSTILPVENAAATLSKIIKGEEKKQEQLKGFALLKKFLQEKEEKDRKAELERIKEISNQSKVKQAITQDVQKRVQKVKGQQQDQKAIQEIMQKNLATEDKKVTNQSRQKRAMVAFIQRSIERISPNLKMNAMKRAMAYFIQKRLHRINIQSEQNKRDIKEMQSKAQEALKSGDPKMQKEVLQQQEIGRKKMMLKFKSALMKKYKMDEKENTEKQQDAQLSKLEQITQAKKENYGVQNEQIMVNNVRDSIARNLDIENKKPIGDTFMLKLVQQIKGKVMSATKNEAEENKGLQDDNVVLSEQKIQLNEIVDNFKNEIQMQAIIKRSENNKCYKNGLQIANSKPFSYLIMASIVCNTILLGLDKYPQEQAQEKVIEYINLLFYAVFLVEMVVKLIGFGFKGYFEDFSNTFDFTIVLLSTIDVVIFFLPQPEDGAEEDNTMSRLGTVSQVFRIFRLLRVFKLAKSWTTFNYFLVTMGNTLQKISTFTVLMYLFIFMYTILGMEMFSNQARFNLNNEPIPPFDGQRDDTSDQWDVPMANFNNFLSATTSVFIVLSNDGWTPIYFDQYRSGKPLRATLFFLSLVIMGQMILFNLFLSMLMKEFDEGEMISDTSKDKKKKSIFKRLKQRCCGRENTQQKMKNALRKKIKKELKTLNNKSLGLLSEQNACRISCRKITNLHQKVQTDEEKMQNSNWFDNFIMLTITVSSILLALESPLNDPDGNTAKVLQIFDYITTAIFCFEIVVKVGSTGFMFNGEQSYMKNSWNVMDFVIVVISLISLIPMNINLSVLKVIRMARLLRPLRVISKSENLKLSIQALVVATPAIASLLVIYLLVMFIFGIIAVNLFKGKSFECDVTQIVGLGQKQIEQLIVTKQDCLNYGGTWVRKHYHFDNIQNAVMNMVVMSQTVNWSFMMFSIVNSSGPEAVPVFYNSPFVVIFFILFIIFGAFFMTNLFVGVVINAFNKESDRLGKDFLLTSEQKLWIQTKVLLLNTRPKIAMIKPIGSEFRMACFKVAKHAYFEIFILVAIILNSLGLCIKWPNMSEDSEATLEKINYFFTAIFTIEAVIKLIAFGWRYFKDNWNRFDFLIVVTSLTFIILAHTSNIDLGTTAQVIRTLRVSRMMKFFRSFKQMKIIFATFVNTMPSLLNVGGLLFLIIYIFAVIGINLFADIKVQAPMSNRLNFQNIFNSYFTLILISTGEGWNDIMNVIGMGKTLQNECIQNPSYEQYQQAGEPIACGNFETAFSFFFLFMILVTLTFLNLFIAIILAGYFDARDMEKKILNNEILDSYQENWSHFDPNATGEIPVEKFPKLMFKLDKPLGWNQKFRGKTQKQQTFIEMISEKAVDNQKLNFSSVLDELALIYVLKKEVERQTEGMNVQSSDEDEEGDRENIMEKKKTLQQAEQMSHVKLVKDMKSRQTTKKEKQKEPNLDETDLNKSDIKAQLTQIIGEQNNESSSDSQSFEKAQNEILNSIEQESEIQKSQVDFQVATDRAQSGVVSMLSEPPRQIITSEASSIVDKLGKADLKCFDESTVREGSLEGSLLLNQISETLEMAKEALDQESESDDNALFMNQS